MKKYLLSSIVIISFLFYSFLARKNPNSPALISPINRPNVNPNTNHNIITVKNGTYTGNVADAFYGNIQVAAVIANSKLTQVNILQSPNDRNLSIAINAHALPILQSEAIKAQSASVDIVTGATDTSQAFINSLKSALNHAKN